MRKHYIDNLRNYSILLLFPVHTFMIWNNFGSGFYIWEKESRLLSTCIVLVNPWFMPLLFVLAGMSARYALQRQSNREFIKRRALRLLVPFLGGMILLVPIQTLYARKYFDGYEGTLPDNWKYFFTHVTDFSGYDGAFTPGHLWFILYLFLIALLALAVFHFIPYETLEARIARIPAWGIWLLFVPVWLMYYIGNIGGYSIGKYLALYLLGYYVLSTDSVMERLDRNAGWLAGLCVPGTILSVLLYYHFSYYGDLWVNYIGWNTILVLLIAARRFLNRSTRATVYLNGMSYPMYILHQSILVALAYYVVRLCTGMALQALLICFGSFALTVLACHVIRLLPYVRVLAGFPAWLPGRGKARTVVSGVREDER